MSYPKLTSSLYLERVYVSDLYLDIQCSISHFTGWCCDCSDNEDQKSAESHSIDNWTFPTGNGICDSNLSALLAWIYLSWFCLPSSLSLAILHSFKKLQRVIQRSILACGYSTGECKWPYVNDKIAKRTEIEWIIFYALQISLQLINLWPNMMKSVWANKCDDWFSSSFL